MSVGRTCDRCGSDEGQNDGYDGIWGALCGPCFEVVPIVRIGALWLPGETFCPNCRRLRAKYEVRGAVMGWFPRAWAADDSGVWNSGNPFETE